MVFIETSKLLQNLVVAGFFGRQGGVSAGRYASLNCSFKVGDEVGAVIENRQRALKALDRAKTPLFIPNLIHSNIVISDKNIITSHKFVDADAVVTDLSNIALGVTYADCLPIIMSSLDGQVIGVVHAGWRGVIHQIIKEVVDVFSHSFGVKDIIAVLGPVISPTTFMVTDNVLDLFLKNWPSYVIKSESFGQVDLRSIAFEQLKRCGVTHIDVVGGYTDAHEEIYFSYRRDQGQTGRHIAIIAKK